MDRPHAYRHARSDSGQAPKIFTNDLIRARGICSERAARAGDTFLGGITSDEIMRVFRAKAESSSFKALWLDNTACAASCLKRAHGGVSDAMHPGRKMIIDSAVKAIPSGISISKTSVRLHEYDDY